MFLKVIIIPNSHYTLKIWSYENCNTFFHNLPHTHLETKIMKYTKHFVHWKVFIHKNPHILTTPKRLGRFPSSALNNIFLFYILTGKLKWVSYLTISDYPRSMFGFILTFLTSSRWSYLHQPSRPIIEFPLNMNQESHSLSFSQQTSVKSYSFHLFSSSWLSSLLWSSSYFYYPCCC